MKEKILETGTGQKLIWNAKVYSLRLIITKVLYFLSGLLISRSTIFGRYYPFGLSFAGAVPAKNTAVVILGSIIGFLMPLRMSSGIRYISTVIAIGAIRWTLSDLTKIRNHFLYAPGVVFVSTLVTGLALDSAAGFNSADIAMSFLESVIAGIGAYFFDRSFKIFTEKKHGILSIKEYVCMAVSITILALSLVNISFGSVSLGRAVGIALILFSCYTMGVFGGSITGIAAGIIFSLPTFGMSYITGAYSFGGMIAGLFSPINKLAICVAFLFASTVASFQSGNLTLMVSGFYESFLGIIIFLLIPQNIFKKSEKFLPSLIKESKIGGIKNTAMQKLRFASLALGSVAKFVENISEKLAKNEAPNEKILCMNSVYKTCSRCNLRMLCWERNHEITRNNFENAINILENNGKLSKTDFSDEFKKTCNKKDGIFETLLENHKNFIHQKTANLRVTELRKVVSEQFGGMSKLLEDIAQDFEAYKNFDEALAGKIKNKLEDFNIFTNSVTCQTDKNNLIFVEIEADSYEVSRFDRKSLKEISRILGRRLDEPQIVNIGDISRISITEQKNFEVEFGRAQHACGNGRFCGDSICEFGGSDGAFNVIISDGMGTGGKAAIEGMMTSELMGDLIKSGISFGSAVSIVNSALLVKSREESLATVDALSLNLFTGKARFMKAGAPASYLKKGEKIRKIDVSSLPIGILNDVSFSEINEDFEDGDCILMVSDGITDIDDGWVQDIFENFNEDSIEKLAKLVVMEAVKKRLAKDDDDITAVALRIKETHRV